MVKTAASWLTSSSGIVLRVYFTTNSPVTAVMIAASTTEDAIEKK